MYSGMTQMEVAHHLKLDRSTYAYYETDKSRPDYDTLLRIASIYQVSTDYLLGRVDELEDYHAPIVKEPRASYKLRLPGAEALSLLPDEEKSFLVAFRQLDGEQREVLLSYMLTLMEGTNPTRKKSDG